MSLSLADKASSLYQILSGKLANRRDKYPLVEWDALFDFFFAFYEANCTPDKNMKDKSVGYFNKQYQDSVEQLKSLRITRHDFEIIKTIGKGHFGEVHVVKEKKNNIIHAMKVLKKSATLSQDQTAFFFEERDIMAYAAGEWVTSLNYAFHDHENLYLVMEFLPGGDLLQLLTRYDDSMVDEKTAQFYLSEIMIAVNCVHKIGYVHRDIKPENILLDLTGHVKLADFGSSAKLVNGFVSSKMPVGTPEYIAPEVLTSMDREGGRYGSECDYWSIGVVAYEMMLGELPFEADGVLQLYSKIMDFKNSLSFPDDVTLSDDAISLMKSLICGQSERLPYSALIKHKFFQSLDWTTIRNMRPPFVPELKSTTDTSNFEDMKTARTLVSGSAFNKGTPQVSNLLPFIGFTFTRSLYQWLQADISKVSRSNHEGFKHTMTIRRRPEKAPTGSTTGVDDIKAKLETELKAREEISSKLLLAETQNKYYAEELEKQKIAFKQISEARSVDQAQDPTDAIASVLLDILTATGIHSDGDNSAMISTLKSEYKKLTLTRDELSRKIEEISVELKSNEIKLKSMSDTRKTEDENLKTVCTDLKTSIEYIQKTLENNNKELTKQVAHYKELYEKDNKNVNELKMKLKELESENIGDKKTGLKDSDLNETAAVISELTNRNEELTLNLERARSIQEEQKIQIEKLENMVAEKVKQCEKVNQNYVNSQSSLQDLYTQIEKYQKELGAFHLKQKEAEILQGEMDNRMKTLLQEKLDLEFKLSSSSIMHDTSAENSHLKSTLEQTLREMETLRNKPLLTDSVNHLESTRTIELQAELDVTRSKLEKSTEECKKLKEEVENYVETIAIQKVTNYDLAESIEEYQKELEKEMNKYTELSNKYDVYKTKNEEVKFMLTERLNQQEKLIEFIQAKVETKGKRKKMFGMSKSGTRESNKNSVLKSQVSVVPAPLETKDSDLRLQLERERNTIVRLNASLLEANNEISMLKEKLLATSTSMVEKKSISPTQTMSNSRVNSASNSQVDANSDSLLRTTFKEHTFSDVISSTNKLCSICLTPIYRGFQEMSCSICQLSCHEDCESVKIYQCQPIFPLATNIPTPEIIMNYSTISKPISFPIYGWLNMPNKISINKHEWIQKWVILTETSLIICETEMSIDDCNLSNASGFNVYDFTRGHYILHSAVSSPLMFSFANASNLKPFWAIKIPLDIGNTSDKKQLKKTRIYFCANSIEEKLFWVSVMNDVIIANRKNDSGNKEYSILDTEEFNREATGEINDFIVGDDNNHLSGMDKGLGYITWDVSNFGNIELTLLPNFLQVHSVIKLKEGLILIHGIDRHLLKIDKNTIEKIKSGKYSLFDPAAFHFLPKLVGCNVIKLDKIDRDHYLFIAVNKIIHIYKMESFNNFKPFNDLVMNDHITNMLCTSSGVIISTVSLYCFRLKTGDAVTAFLDKNDTSLAFFIFGNATNGNVLMDIFDVSTKKGVEYLICYSEAGVFVNGEGSRTKTNNLEWRGVPISFAMKNMKLFVCYINFVGVYDLAEGLRSTSISSGSSKRSKLQMYVLN